MDAIVRHKLVSYSFAFLSMILYIAKLSGITYIAFSCCAGFENSNNVIIYSIGLSSFSILKIYLYQSVLVGAVSNIFLSQICPLLEITISIQFGFFTLLNQHWYPCIDWEVASTVFVFIILDTLICGYYAFHIITSNWQNIPLPERMTSMQNPHEDSDLECRNQPFFTFEGKNFKHKFIQ